MSLRTLLFSALLPLLATAPLFAAVKPAWMEPFPAYRVVGNVYYVGSEDLASYLIVTPDGDILINSSLKQSVPLIRKSVESLGFKFSDIKILLISHAHWDHDAGSAEVKRLTGAKYMAMEQDVSVVETGGRTDFHYGADPAQWYERARVDRVLHDGDEVRLGGTVLVAHLTPGHTKGCTTWTMKAAEAGRTYNVVIVGSPNVNPGYKLVNNAKYPGIAGDYAKTFRVLDRLPCDVFLGAHGAYYGMEAKYARMKTEGEKVWVDPAGYKAYVEGKKAVFEAELAKQEAAAR